MLGCTQVSTTTFGHAALGGTMMMFDPVKRFSMAITVNELTLDREVVRRVAALVAAEVGLGKPLNL